MYWSSKLSSISNDYLRNVKKAANNPWPKGHLPIFHLQPISIALSMKHYREISIGAVFLKNFQISKNYSTFSQKGSLHFASEWNQIGTFQRDKIKFTFETTLWPFFTKKISENNLETFWTVSFPKFTFIAFWLISFSEKPYFWSFGCIWQQRFGVLWAKKPPIIGSALAQHYFCNICILL